jgi:hypothetical protein
VPTTNKEGVVVDSNGVCTGQFELCTQSSIFASSCYHDPHSSLVLAITSSRAASAKYFRFVMRRRSEESIDDDIRREERRIQRLQKELLLLAGNDRQAQQQQEQASGQRRDVEGRETAARDPNYDGPSNTSADTSNGQEIQEVSTGNRRSEDTEPDAPRRNPYDDDDDDNGRDEQQRIDDEELFALLLPSFRLDSVSHSSLLRNAAMSLNEPEHGGPASVDKRLLQLQAHVAGFEVENVEFASKTDRTVSYRFSIRFFDDDHLRVELVVEFVKQQPLPPDPNHDADEVDDGDEASHGDDDDDDDDVRESPRHRRSPRRQIESVRFHFSQGWVHQELHKDGFVRSDNVLEEPWHVASVLSRVISYLEFDAKRRAFLARYPFVVPIRSECSVVLLRIPLLKRESHVHAVYESLSERNDVLWLHMEWKWCWKAEKDQLQMVPPLLERLESMAVGLEKLVEVTGSCQDAIVAVLNLPPTVADSAPATAKRRRGKKVRTRTERDDDAAEPEALSEYELRRQENVRRNNQRLHDLGLMNR